MKKKMVMILLAIAAMACTGCGEIPEPSTTGTEAIETTEETKTEEELAADLEQLEAAIAAEAEPAAEADLVAEADDGDVIIEITDQSAEENVTNRDLENFIKAKVEEQLAPVKVAAEANWEKLTGVKDESVTALQSLGVKVAEASKVEVTDVNLENGTVTYKVSAPNIREMVTKVMEADKSGDPLEVYMDMLLYLESEEMGCVSDDVTVSIETAGRCSYLKVKGKDVLDQVTGGLVEFADELAAYVKTIK